MLTLLTGKRQSAIAWFLFVLFYAEMAGSVYASKTAYYIPMVPYHYNSSVLNNNSNDYSAAPIIAATLIDRKMVNVIKADKPVNEAGFFGSPEKSSSPEKNNGPAKINIGGPGQPEMSTFKSVGADNMVNLFTGDFSYNIPLLDVDGYPINIFYNGGPTMDQEASWVGLGWNINPGTISRNMRGLPDDFDGTDKVTKEQSMKPDMTVGVTGSVSIETVGVPIGGSLSGGVFYNSKRGVGLEAGITGEFKAQKNITRMVGDTKTAPDTAVTIASISVGLNLNSQTGLTPSVSFQKSMFSKDKNDRLGLSTSIDFNSRTGLGDLRLDAEFSRNKYEEGKNGYAVTTNSATANLSSTSISFARTSYTPSIRMPVTTFNASFKAKLGLELYPVTLGFGVSGYYSKTSLARKYSVQSKEAVGYMYYEKAMGNKNALMDFNRLNDGNYTYKTPIISIPVYTYDVFSISGEGTGGSFRGYRGTMGYVKDNYTRTNSGKVNLDLDLGTTSTIKVGATIGGVYSATIAGEWGTENALKHTAAFSESENILQKGFYFKNPGEKAIIDEDFYNTMGQDKLMRPMMGTTSNGIPPFYQPTTTLQSRYQLFNSRRETDGTTAIDFSNSFRKIRDKRTQVISYLTAFEADRVGLDRYIYSYQENVFKPGMCAKDMDKTYRTPVKRDALYRQRHHISEITVQEGSKRYIYGLPVYQTKQKELTFSIGATKQVDAGKGQVTYSAGTDNSNENKEGKDGLFQSETVDAYAHSFLLTAILSPDYSDVTGDGISDDDLGTAIKFNYSRVNKKTSGPNSWATLNWRLPVEEGKANFNRGLVTDNGDNKALYTYGEKELWYTHSIESKNMVATFRLSDRKDGWGVAGENGGVLTGTGGGACQKKLDRIDLYSKADLIKYGANAKPVKSVHFTYSYKLCRGYSLFSGDAAAGNGKLTLESIYFTYNNNTHQKNKYRFKYAEEESNTVVYNSVESDRWGNYKPHTQNPNGISNENYPYAVQNKTQADANAATWNLNQILLPSGAKIDIAYEADDYAYVQNRRAAQMTSILGFGHLPTSTPGNKLFDNSNFQGLWNFEPVDHRYVFFNAPVTVTNKADIKRLYLQDLKQLLFKLWVKVPKDSYGEGYEPMFVYCNIEDYNIVPNSGGNKFYVKVGKAAHNNGSQLMETVYQFLRDQLPSKAFPGYDVGNKSGVGQIVKALYGMVNNVRTGVTGFENNARADGWCREVDLVNSAARLSNPLYKRTGGGHRVKSVKITDNFKRMLNSNAEIASVYGQEYDYTTTEIVNGQVKIISSGVASYEPGVGNEENPFREILQYSNKNPLGPTANSNIELPVAEMFFPAASVGYSRVTVKSIHNKTNKNIKSAVGMQETQFYTTRDFPTLSDFTDFDPSSRHHYKPSAINKIFNFAQKNYMTLLQGFRVVLNDMNGKVKMQASYAETDLKNPINKTSYFYRMNKTGENKYSLDNIVPVVGGPDGKVTNKLVGKDIEVMNDFREHFTFTHSAQIPLNLDFFTLGAWPVLLPTVFRAIFRDESMYRSATTLKVVNLFGILDSIEVMDKGSIVGTKNLVYDAETGEVLVSRTNNEFNKPIYNFSYPAYWANEAMGPAYKNIDVTYKKVLFRNGKIEGGITETEINNIFESGDEIYVFDNASAGPKDNAGCINIGSGNPCTLLPQSAENRIWALDITKDTRNTTKEFIFIDRYGNPYHAADANIRIIRSGRRNMTDAAVGSITSMANPLLLKPDNITFDKIFIDNNTNIINTGAIEFKERWKTQDAFYTLDEIQRVVRQAPIVSGTVNTIQSAAFGNYFRGRGTRWKELYVNPNHFIATQYDGGGGQPDFRLRSWLLFNFDNLTNLNGNSSIVSANLNLPSHQDNHSIKVAGRYIGSSHNSLSSHYAFWKHPNDFIISRMQSSWPSFASFNIWEQKFQASPPVGVNNSKYILGTYPVWGGSNENFNEDITRVVRGMLQDKYDPAKAYATALMINLNFENVRKQSVARVCFDKINPWLPDRNINIKLKYYNCVPENPIIYQGPAAGAPTIPPPGYMYCNTDEKVTNCYSVFTRQFMNPYVQGLLGNWRPLKSYVYNGERREQVLAPPPTVNSTTINKDGIIKDFETFWSLDPVNNKQITRTNITSNKWVWNSAITQYNRKGAELENFDPLGRYNTGIYGYNESLPVAVVNNSRLRLSAFDGFEDYFFKDQNCELFCKPNKRHFDTKINTSQLDETEAHTGKYSLKTAGNTTASIKLKVSADNSGTEPDIYIKTTRTQTNIPWVVPIGKGLTGNYYHDPELWGTRVDEQVSLYYDRSTSNIPFGLPYRGGNTIVWTGKVQVAESGTYKFTSSIYNDKAVITVSKPGVFSTVAYQQCNSHISCSTISNPVNLTAGELYDIHVHMADENSRRNNAGGINLSWLNTCVNKWELVPKRNLYPTAADANGSVISSNSICTKIDQIKALSNYLIDGFELIPDEKMIASVWVKKGTVDCRCPLYDGFTIKLKSSSDPNVATLMAKGPIIEGWQLFEAAFTVPSTSELDFYIDNGNNNLPLFIDDLRFHPYNANMKSFVYNPYNLKPAAELDENNYASFYEYDDDGTLIRVKKETRMGIKTIQETRSGLQKKVTDF